MSWGVDNSENWDLNNLCSAFFAFRLVRPNICKFKSRYLIHWIQIPGLYTLLLEGDVTGGTDAMRR